ncbi:MAG: DUF956 family protein [Streptococcaceae bacterium]|jgi:hypothetical protein|nr:DUF956 family protein [Streptococcaceae bacterium]
MDKVQSLNTRADLAVEAVAYIGFPKYGKIMVGDKALEFFNDKYVADNMQFPWASIRRVEGQVSKGGKIGRTFYIVLQNNNKIRFNSHDAGHILKLVREQIGNDKVVRIPSLGESFKKLAKRIFMRRGN